MSEFKCEHRQVFIGDFIHECVEWGETVHLYDFKAPGGSTYLVMLCDEHVKDYYARDQIAGMVL